MPYLTALHTALPKHGLSQAQAADWAKTYHSATPALARIIDSVHTASGIGTRYSVLSDFGELNPADWTFFKAPGHSPGTAARMEVYQNHALNLSAEACRGALLDRGIAGAEITHLIIASCTGMYAPGLDLDLMETLGIPESAERTAIHYMGCHAAVNVLKTARHICRSEPEAKVLCVCVELCSIHVQNATDRDSILSSTLFGDGAAAMIVEAEPRSDGVSLGLQAFRSIVAHKGKADMAWNIGDSGFRMSLSAYVPALIEEGIPDLLTGMADELADARVGWWAIHPGGRRILEACSKALSLSEVDLVHSYGVLSDCGNMSSPTVLFVLDRIRKEIQETGRLQPIFGAAFGPGLAMETMLLKPVMGD